LMAFGPQPCQSSDRGRCGASAQSGIGRLATASAVG
jgi:hypothetical protein